MIAATALLALATFSQVAAHGGVLSYSWGGNWYKGFVPYNTAVGQVTIQREWDTYNPIQDATDPTISCNDAGTSLGANQLTGTIAAGTPITAYWNQVWPHSIGPMITYLASCGGDCTSANSDTLSWFKIDQAGLLSGTVYSGSWADGEMINDNSSWTSTIPSCIPAGNYLIRFETIALHSQPAQFYPECAQLTITGGGSTSPSASQMCKFPGCYSNSDPGIDIDVYGVAAQTQTTYVIPGPPLFTCSGGGGTSPTTTTTKSASTTTKSASTTTIATKSTTTTTTKSSTTTTHSTTTTTASGATQTIYGQCGGTGYTGPTTCASGSSCHAVSPPYYSQCLSP